MHKTRVRKEIQIMGIKRPKTQVTSGFVSSVLDLIKDCVTVPDDLWDSDPNILIFDDCVLELNTGNTRPHSPDDYATSKLPFKYDPIVKSDEWEKFLNSTVPDSKDFLQEFAGLSATSETKHEIALWLYGPPGGGKSTFIAGLESMLGSKCGILGLSEIERSSFALTSLMGKTLLVATESSQIIKHSHLINAIISGEPVMVERKYEDAFSYTPHAKIVWAMNELPPIQKDGVGLFRRVVPIHFPGVLRELRDPRMKETIASQGQAIINWALEGLARLRARGRFEIPKHLLDAQGLYREQNDNIVLFLEECCVAVEKVDEKGHYQKTQSRPMYDKYLEWCKRHRSNPLNIKAFAADLQQKGFEKKPIDGRECWIGLVFSDGEFDVVM